MQTAGPGNRANPLHIVLPTCLHPFRTTIRNRPATQAAAQAIESARLLLLSERRGPISRVGNIKPRVGMSILHASIQITIPRAHRRRLSSILKTPSRRRGSPGYFSYQTNGLPHLTHGVRTHIVATQQKTTRKRPAKKSKPAENATMGVCKIVCVSPLKGQRLRRRSSPAQGAGHATMAAAWPAADWRRP